MIARHWRGWIQKRDADAYESLLKDKVLPSLKEIDGFKGSYVLRENGPEEVEFVVVNLFDSLDAVKRFAGPKYETSVFEPEARKLLSHIDLVAKHYEVCASTV
jgi:heme-degrading monooxygenase HmoA